MIYPFDDVYHYQHLNKRPTTKSISSPMQPKQDSLNPLQSWHAETEAGRDDMDLAGVNVLEMRSVTEYTTAHNFSSGN